MVMVSYRMLCTLNQRSFLTVVGRRHSPYNIGVLEISRQPTTNITVPLPFFLNVNLKNLSLNNCGAQRYAREHVHTMSSLSR